MAADHRAAAQALRDAEGTSCGGIAESDRDVSPFDHREDITSVTAYETKSPVGTKQQTEKLQAPSSRFAPFRE